MILGVMLKMTNLIAAMALLLYTIIISLKKMHPANSSSDLEHDIVWNRQYSVLEVFVYYTTIYVIKISIIAKISHLF